MKSIWIYVLMYTSVFQLSEPHFESSLSLKKLFKLESNLVKLMEKKLKDILNSIEKVKSYKKDVVDMYSKEGCWPPETCSDYELQNKLIGNPIYDFQVIKRLTVDFNELQEQLKENSFGYENILNVKNHHKNLPTLKDLIGAANSMNRLQDMYNFNTTKFSNGNILGYQTNARLEPQDTFYLGRQATNSKFLRPALHWLQSTMNMINSNYSSSSKMPQEKQVKLLMDQVSRKLQSNKGSKTDLSDTYIIGHYPPKTTDSRKIMTDNDRKNYQAICQGQELLPIGVKSKLRCYLDNMQESYFKLAPIKVEENHGNPNKILTFHDILSDREISRLIKQAKPKMTTASVGADKSISDIRISANAWLPDSTQGMDSISKKINLLTGLQTSQKLDEFNEGKKEEYEMLQVANYGLGGHYDCHQDSIYIYKDSNFIPTNIEEPKDTYFTGDRMATFMIYLSEVYKGGLTAFPRLGIAVTPKKGSAVFWYNLRKSGESDMLMLHGACPVLLGDKWVANKWIREVPNIFKRPCSTNKRK